MMGRNLVLLNKSGLLLLNAEEVALGFGKTVKCGEMLGSTWRQRRESKWGEGEGSPGGHKGGLLPGKGADHVRGGPCLQGSA